MDWKKELTPESWSDWLALLLTAMAVTCVTEFFFGTWIEKHTGLAAWVQAAGTILAIVGTAVITRESSQVRVQAEQRVAAMEIAAYLRRFMRECAGLAERLRTYITTDGLLGNNVVA